MLRTCRWWRLSVACLRLCGLALCLLLSPVSRAEYGMPLQFMQVAEQSFSVKQAVELVRSQYKGQVVKATETEFQGRPAYRIRLVNAGRVRDVLVDAQSGQIINVRGSDE